MIAPRESQNGLPNWTDIRRDPKVVPLTPSARRLCWLRHTPYVVEQQSWIGLIVKDRYGQPLGRVRDFLIEVRSVDETAGRPGAIAAFVVVKSGRWPRSREVLFPISRLAFRDGDLYAHEAAAALRPLLFGR